jgi:hypothetical protein
MSDENKEDARHWRRLAIILMIVLFVLAALYGPTNDPELSGVSRQGAER